MKESFYIPQDCIPNKQSRILVRHYSSVDHDLLPSHPTVLGMSLQLSSRGEVKALALATSEDVLLISPNSKSNISPTDSLLADILTCKSFPLAGFDMARMALHLSNDWNYQVRGVDISDALSLAGDKRSPSNCVGSKLGVNVDSSRIDEVWKIDAVATAVCIRAWISAVISEQYFSEISSSQKIDTRRLNKQELRCLSQLVVQDHTMEFMRPTVMQNDFSDISFTPDGGLQLKNERFSNRVRRSNKTSVALETDNGVIHGRPTSTKGKTTTISTPQSLDPKRVKKVTVIGREEATSAQRARNEFVFLVLLGELELHDSPFIQLLWFPRPDNVLKRRERIQGCQLAGFTDMNDSQRGVISRMVADDAPLVIVHGPPGTGKSTTIACAAEIWDRDHGPAWIVAQSNVAVLNIAKSLRKRSVKFKMIVSEDFYTEWHEDIYADIQENVIITDELPRERPEIQFMISGSSIMLCTLSMLSNPILELRNVFDVVRVGRLVVDEASQIDVFEYMHIFHKFRKWLVKVCLFGDPKQLPPYGRDNVPSLQCIFDLKHLKPDQHFLNIQYRMPIPLGEFISQNVYDQKLFSKHKIEDMSCVSFIDVTKGREGKSGKSFINLEEVHTVVNLVRYYYNGRDFCVITPYDAQRAALQKQLKAEHLPHESVFNADSFQGNEADFVLISVVRTEAAGFLKSIERVNVILTRCKRGMVIVTNRNFLKTSRTLLGELAYHWETTHGQSKTWIDWRLVAEQKADLPGVRGHHRQADVPTFVSRPVNTVRKAPTELQSPSNYVHPLMRPSGRHGVGLERGVTERKTVDTTLSPSQWPALKSSHRPSPSRQAPLNHVPLSFAGCKTVSSTSSFKSPHHQRGHKPSSWSNLPESFSRLTLSRK